VKRLVWLLILMFGTALAQVSPVDFASQQGKTCSCCKKSGACGQPDCGLPPSAPTSSNVPAEQPQRSLSTTTQKRAARIYRLAINYLFQPKLQSPGRSIAAGRTVSVESVPLFEAQCSFLI
jgi:hypothetical protein